MSSLMFALHKDAPGTKSISSFKQYVLLKELPLLSVFTVTTANQTPSMTSGKLTTSVTLLKR